MVKKEYICQKSKKSSIIIEDSKTEIKKGETAYNDLSITINN